MGSLRSQSLETDVCLVTEAWFPSGAVLEPHVHPRPVFSVMLNGAFLTAVGGRRLLLDRVAVATASVAAV